MHSYYRAALDAHGFEPDAHQLSVVDALQHVADRLRAPAAGRWARWLGRTNPESSRGLYLWGGVGRGKTWLMDLFFDHVDEPRRQRLHFHHFMQQVHAELSAIEGRKNPLEIVARRMARQWRLLCLDEFHVVDIGDAMILAGLLKALFAEGMVLVTTSNVPPDGLYRDGIQRASFLPAIRLLQTHLEVVRLEGGRDFRSEVLSGMPLFHCPADEAAERQLQAEFFRLAPAAVEQAGELVINGRAMPYRYRADDMVWFDFEALCGPPRSQHDYIELARCHHTVFLSGVPQMGASRDDRTRRFIFLIDEFYDRRVKLVLSAAAPVERLYQGERLAFEFQRTVSRLTEMQTAAYLG
ncbi:MAG: AFG1 family ATPase, partial [Gammaproteobacteria bacterium]